MGALELRLYDLLKIRVGNEEAEAFMETLDETVTQKVDMATLDLATKRGMNALREAFTELSLATKQDINKLRQAFAELSLATKQDMNELRQDFAELRLATKQDMNELRQDFVELRLSCKEDIHTTKIDLIKWVFGFWITTILLIVGLYLKN